MSGLGGIERGRRRAARRGAAGFTLVEVMIALAILGFSLIVLIKNTANNIQKTQNAYLYGVTTDLARGKMYDIEEKLAKDGFQDTDQDADGDFSEEGWPSITYSYKIEAVELPDLSAVQDVAKQAAGSGSGAGSGAGAGSAGAGSGSEGLGSGAGFANSGLAGMLGMFGGGDLAGMGGGSDAKGASFLQSQFELVKQVLKASIRKISLTLNWEVMGSKRSMLVVAYVTDPAGMNKVIGGLGLGGGGFGGGGGGSGSGSGSGSGGGSRIPPRGGR